MIKIPKQTNITGKLQCDCSLECQGNIDGESEIKGLLIIGKDSVWSGKAVADEIIVEGQFNGKIIAHKKLEIKPSARITGEVIAPKVLISKSAILDCTFTMVKQQPAVNLDEHREQKQLLVPQFSSTTNNAEEDELLPNTLSTA